MKDTSAADSALSCVCQQCLNNPIRLRASLCWAQHRHAYKHPPEIILAIGSSGSKQTRAGRINERKQTHIRQVAGSEPEPKFIASQPDALTPSPEALMKPGAPAPGGSLRDTGEVLSTLSACTERGPALHHEQSP